MGKKDDKKKTAEELNTLFRPVEQKVAKGKDWLVWLCSHALLGHQ